MTVLKILGMLLVLASAPAFAQQVIGEPRLLDGFEDATSWRVVTSNEVSGKLRVIDGVEGRALCLESDFNDVPAYVAINSHLLIDYPDNHAVASPNRGDYTAHTLAQ